MLKKFIQSALLLVVLFTTAHSYAQVSQAPDGIQFQALATDANGRPAAGRVIYVRDAIIAKSATGSIVYSETFKVTASSAGIFTIVLGKGTYASGVTSIANIDWSNGPFFLNLKIAVEPTVPNAGWNVNNEYVDLGTSQFWSVPYALYAGNVRGADGKLNTSDTAAMLKPYFTAINFKANTADVNISLASKANTSDMNSALATKVDKATGKELSTNDYTTAEKIKLASISGTNTGDQINITGNAATATKLATARKINGVDFDGTGDITVTATADAGTLTGTTLKSTVTNSSLTSVGTLTNLTVTNPITGSVTGNAATATTAGNITATANTTLTSLSNLATVGTITSGVWSGTAVAIEKGGTGLTSAGTNGQVLTSTGSGTLSWTTPSTTATAYNGVLPIANGGTGSSTQNFVDLTTGQYIDGTKTFKENILVNYGTDGTQAVRIGAQGGNYNTMFGAATFLYGTPGIYNTAIGGFALASLNGGNENTAVGLNAIRQGGAADGSRNTAVGVAALTNGSGTNDNTAIGTYTLAGSITGGSNVAVGNNSLQNNTSANYNVGVGYESLKNTTTGGNNTAIGHGSMKSNTIGDVNTAVGENSLISNTIGRYNTAIGVQAQEQNTTGAQNTAIGVAAIDRNTAGNYNAVLGAFSGRYIADNSTYNTAIDNSVLVGALSRPLANNANNEIVIGYNAIGNGSNTVTIGNTSITNLKTSGTITADAVTYPSSHGTSGQVLSTTGSGTLAWTTIPAGPIFKQSRVNQNTTTGTADSEIEVGGMAFRYNIQSQKIEVKRTTNLESEWQAYNTSRIEDGISQALQRPDIISTSSTWTQFFDSWTNGSLTISGYYHSYEFEMTPYLRGQASDNHSFNIKVLLDGWGVVTLRVIYY